MIKYRIEKDSLGEVLVPSEKYWGAQTERSRNNFKIGPYIPLEIIKALAYVKKAVANTNYKLNVLSKKKKNLISKVCDEIIEGKLDDQFPLVIWQTETNSNMNINEVIANRAQILDGKKLVDSKLILNPNNDVNKSQSSNDIYSTAMNIASYKKLIEVSIPCLEKLRNILKQKSVSFRNKKHVTLAQEFSGYVSQLDHGLKALENTLEHLSELVIGKKVVEYIIKYTGLPLKTSENNDASLVCSHAALKQLAISLIKIANDIIKHKELNQSITMICTQIISNDVTISWSLHVFKPVIVYNFLQSAKLIGEACISFANDSLNHYI